MFRFLFAIFLVVFGALPALSQNRHALVVGIDNYENVARLSRARNDAIAISDLLERQGLDVTTLLDIDRRAFNHALGSLAQRIEPGDEVVFYFAGHGIEIEGRNFLFASDVPYAHVGQEHIVTGEGFPVDRIMNMFEEARVRVLILDACRENPFARNGTRSLGGTRGLAHMSAAEGSFVLFSAGAGQLALDRLGPDDDDPNSVFTRVLLPYLEERGRPFHEIARLVRAEVRQLAASVNHDQRPAYYDEIVGNFVFSAPFAGDMPPPPPPPAENATNPCDAALAEWDVVSRTFNQGLLVGFIGAHQGCNRAVALAQERLDMLRSLGAASEDALNALPSLPPEPVLEGPELVRRIQQELNRVGCVAGPEDGVAGARTLAGARSFLEQTGGSFVNTPIYSQEFLAMLQTSPEGVCPVNYFDGQWSITNVCFGGFREEGTITTTTTGDSTFAIVYESSFGNGSGTGQMFNEFLGQAELFFPAVGTTLVYSFNVSADGSQILGESNVGCEFAGIRVR